MNEIIIAYLGDNCIATNFYSQTDNQKIKRRLLSMFKSYDILPIDYIKIINEKADKMFITGLSNKINDGRFLFNYILDNNIDMRKITTFNGSANLSTTKRQHIEKEDKYASLFEKELNYDIDFKISSTFITMALESVHNLYYKTGRNNNWGNVLAKDTQEFKLFKKEIEEKYNIDKADELFKRTGSPQDRNRQYKIEADQTDRSKLKRLRYKSDTGFKANINAASTKAENTVRQNGIFMFFFENVLKEYWELDNKDYYMVSLDGFGYVMRLARGMSLEQLLNRCGIESVEQLQSKEIREQVVRIVYRDIKHLKDKGINIDRSVNSYLISIIKPIYDMSDGVHLFNCDGGCITFAVHKTVNLVDVLKKLDERLEISKMSHCFESVTITKGDNPWEVKSYDVESTVKLNLSHLNKIKDVEECVNGCDKQQVEELFNTLKQLKE